MTTYAAIWTTVSLTLAALPATAACRAIAFDSAPFTVCEVHPSDHQVRLFLNDDEGAPLGTFDAAEALSGAQLSIAMNAGMYHADRRPVGLYIEDGVQKAPIVTRDGPGNFGLLPNGVLCLGPDWAEVVESRRFAEAPPPCTHATQSGPMLVIDGALHPRFLPNSDSLYVRNGAGVRTDGTLVLAISDVPVNFHHFGRLFRDAMNTPNALYFDGNVSRLLARDLGRHDRGLPMGPMIGVIAPVD